MIKEELAFLGMELREKVIPGMANRSLPETTNAHTMNNRGKAIVDPVEQAEQNRLRRKLIQLQNMQEYLQAMVTIRQK